MDSQVLQRVTSAHTTIEILANIFKEYAQRTAFAYCPPGQSSFVTMTYAQAWERVQVWVCRGVLSVQSQNANLFGVLLSRRQAEGCRS